MRRSIELMPNSIVFAMLLLSETFRKSSLLSILVSKSILPKS